MSKDKVVKKFETIWKRMDRTDGRIEYLCEHGIGHGTHEHGCDGCCSRDDFPLKKLCQ